MSGSDDLFVNQTADIATSPQMSFWAPEKKQSPLSNGLAMEIVWVDFVTL